MADVTLLERYRQTRIAMLSAIGFGSKADKSARMAALAQHHETLHLIEAQFPNITHAHSTAEWHLAKGSLTDGN